MSAPAIVAAAPGTTCLVISTRHVHDQGAPLDARGFRRATAREHLVAAWQVWPRDAVGIDWHVEPILATHVVNGCDLVLLPLPGGSWWVPIDGGVRPAGADLSDLAADVEAAEARAATMRDKAGDAA